MIALSLLLQVQTLEIEQPTQNEFTYFYINIIPGQTFIIDVYLCIHRRKDGEDCGDAPWKESVTSLLG